MAFTCIPLGLNPKPFTVATFNINTSRAIDITAIYKPTTFIFDNFFVHTLKMNIKLSHPISDNYICDFTIDTYENYNQETIQLFQFMSMNKMRLESHQSITI
jgi:hypothetical protein